MMARPTAACKVSVFTPRPQCDAGARGVLSHSCRKRRIDSAGPLLCFNHYQTCHPSAERRCVHICGCLWGRDDMFASFAVYDVGCVHLFVFEKLFFFFLNLLLLSIPHKLPVVSNHPETAVNLSQSKRLS